MENVQLMLSLITTSNKHLLTGIWIKDKRLLGCSRRPLWLCLPPPLTALSPKDHTITVDSQCKNAMFVLILGGINVEWAENTLYLEFLDFFIQICCLLDESSISSYFITKYAHTALVSYFCVKSLSNFLNFFVHHVGVSKHVFNVRDRVDDDNEKEEELQSLKVLYTLVTMTAPALLLT